MLIKGSFNEHPLFVILFSSVHPVQYARHTASTGLFPNVSERRRSQVPSPVFLRVKKPRRGIPNGQYARRTTYKKNCRFIGD